MAGCSSLRTHHIIHEEGERHSGLNGKHEGVKEVRMMIFTELVERYQPQKVDLAQRDAPAGEILDRSVRARGPVAPMG